MYLARNHVTRPPLEHVNRHSAACVWCVLRLDSTGVRTVACRSRVRSRVVCFQPQKSKIDFQSSPICFRVPPAPPPSDDRAPSVVEPRRSCLDDDVDESLYELRPKTTTRFVVSRDAVAYGFSRRQGRRRSRDGDPGAGRVVFGLRFAHVWNRVELRVRVGGGGAAPHPLPPRP